MASIHHGGFFMKRLPVILTTALFASLLLLGCSGTSHNPVLPDQDLTPSVQLENSTSLSQTHLWGYYDIYLDPDTKTVEVVPNRDIMFTANVVNFINGNPAGLGFSINSIETGADFTDVDIDIAITHPFPGLPQYNGYDVRGVFMGDGSAELETYNLDYPVLGTDQFMLPNPDTGYGGPDGYTRWFNYQEFSTGGMPLFQYTQGNAATPGFSGTAKINPYKYFANGLDLIEDLFSWLASHAGQNGEFASGATNVRNYYLRFPDTSGVTFGYAILADWEGNEPEFHPSNTSEAVACDVENNSTLYWTGTVGGGDIILDISPWNWDSEITGGVMEDYSIVIESTVLSGPYEADTTDMTPIGGTENYSTYHIEIPADNVQAQDGQEYWVIVMQDGFDYKNDFGTTNLAGDDTLAAFFRYDLTVGSEIPAWIEITSPNGGEEYIPGDDEEITWTSGGLTGLATLEFSNDNFASEIFEIDTAVDVTTGSYLWSVPCHPSDSLRVRITSNVIPTVNDSSDGDFSIENGGWALSYGGAYYEEGRGVDFAPDGSVYLAGTHRPPPGDRNYGFVAKYNQCGDLLWDQAWGGTGHTQGYGVVVDSEGSAYITGNFYGTTNFDPDDPGGPNQITSTPGGTWDVWLVKFDTDGDFVWVKTFGGMYSDSGQDLAIDSSDNVYLSGFYSLTVNFDPDGSDNRTSLGDFDCFVSKFDSSGDYKWVGTWGGTSEDRCWGVATDGSNVYATGFFNGSVDFDPSGGNLVNSTGAGDIFLIAYDSTGAYQWAYGWGGYSNDEGNDVAADSSGNAYVTGFFRGSGVDFDPTGGSDPKNANGAEDSFVSKYSSTGGYEWSETWGGVVTDNGEGIEIDSQGNIYTTGYFWTSIVLDPDGGSTYSAGGFIDGYISKLDSTGDFQWGRVWGGSNQDRGHRVNCDANDSVYVTGFFGGSNVNFAPTDAPCSEPPYYLNESGLSDAFLVKYLAGDGCW